MNPEWSSRDYLLAVPDQHDASQTEAAVDLTA